MTALCASGGPSSPKLQYAAVVDYTATAIGLLLQDTGYPWLVPVLALLSLPPLVLSTFCSTDPPAIPTFVGTETADLLNLNFGASFDSALGKFRDLVLHLAWLELCQCNSGAQPVVPAPTAPPAGTPIALVPVVQPAGYCGDVGNRTITVGITGTGFNMGGVQFSSVPTMTGFEIHAIRGSVGVGPHENASIELLWGAGAACLGSAPYDIVQIAQIPPDGVEHVYPITPPAGYDCVTLNMLFPHLSTDSYGAWLELFCGPASSPGAGCCAGSALVQSSLDLILKMVTLTQRQIAPFAYVRGATHPGISGNGQLAVSGLLGVAVDVTTLPNRVGRTSGNPNDLYDVGWINVGTADGWGPRQFISSDPFLLRPVPGDITLIGYSIPADVVVTITELVREP